MMAVRRYSNRFPTSEGAHAFEQHVTGVALDAGLSVRHSGVKDMGLPGYFAEVTLAGESDELDRFAAQLHQGVRLEIEG